MASESGRYDKLAEIASGGMATVYLARAHGLGGFERLVAVKEMHPHLAKEPEFVAMFLDEARLAARIRHPNVVATVDVTESEVGTLALVMEYVEGPSLQQIVRSLHKQKERLPLDIGLRIFLDALEGLDAAHELTNEEGAPLNLVHRDVSPQNILVSTDGITKLTDFGVARADSRLTSTSTGMIKGKVPYMAPEQTHAMPVDRRTDVYAAGAVLWEMLIGRRYVQAESEVAMIVLITDRAPVSPREVRPDVPDDIARVCVRALQKNPDDRYPTAGDFAEALEHAARAEGITIASQRVVGAYVRALGVHRAASVLAPESRRQEGSLVTGSNAGKAAMPTGSHARPALTSNLELTGELSRKRAFRGIFVLMTVGVAAGLLLSAWLLRVGRQPADSIGQPEERAILQAAPGETEVAPALPSTAPTPLPLPTQAPAAEPAPVKPAGPSSRPAKPPSKGGYRPREL